MKLENDHCRIHFNENWLKEEGGRKSTRNVCDSKGHCHLIRNQILEENISVLEELSYLIICLNYWTRQYLI